MQAFKRVLALALFLSLPNMAHTQTVKPPTFRVLVFFGTAGFFHNSIYYINKVWFSLGDANGFAVDTTRDPKVFNPDSLKKYQVVVFNNVTHAGDVLNADQKAAWWTWSKTHGYLGMHAAADTYGTWPEYSQWMGGELSVHSGTDSGTMNLDTTDFARNHPIVKDQALPAQIRFREEWYSYKVNPRTYPGMHVLYTMDEKTFTPGVVMGDHPIVWVKEQPEGGRMVYMGMGHEDNVFKPELDLGYGFVSKIMLSSVKWAAGVIPVVSAGIVNQASSRPKLRTASKAPGRDAATADGKSKVLDPKSESSSDKISPLLFLRR